METKGSPVSCSRKGSGPAREDINYANKKKRGGKLGEIIKRESFMSKGGGGPVRKKRQLTRAKRVG